MEFHSVSSNQIEVEISLPTDSRQVFVNKEGKLIHPGEFGMYRENIVSNLLKPFLPQRLDIGNGFIITDKNRNSTQCDLIIYDKEHTPVIENGEQRFFPIESVVGIVEIKSILSKHQFKEALIKLTKIKELKNDIENKPYIFKETKSNTKFNARINVQDQLATFLICESIDFEISKEIDTIFKDIYNDIDKSLFHNMILNLNGYCLLYNDGNNPIYYSYFDYTKPSFKNEAILPHKMGYEKEHILAFLNCFYMIISSVSVLDIDITRYLGNLRIKNALIEK